MTENAATWKVAIDLFHMPTRVRFLRSSPVPEDILDVLRIAAGDKTAAAKAIEGSERPLEVVQKAAVFYVEQILLCPEADSYRVLGGNRYTTTSELRRNMALLMRWLHPDVSSDGDRSIYAGRVTRAWEDLKTPARRMAYDNSRRVLRRKKARHVRNKALRSKSHHARGSLRSVLVWLLRRYTN